MIFCRIMTFVSYDFCRIMMFVAYEVFECVTYRVCRSAKKCGKTQLANTATVNGEMNSAPTNTPSLVVLIFAFKRNEWKKLIHTQTKTNIFC